MYIKRGPACLENKKTALSGGRYMYAKLRGLDLNQRSQGYGPCEIPGFSTPQCYCSKKAGQRASIAACLLLIHGIIVNTHVDRIIGKTFYIAAHGPQTRRMHGIELHGIFIHLIMQLFINRVALL